MAESLMPGNGRPTVEHPSLAHMRQVEAEAAAQGYDEGDVNHFLQPLIGHLRRLERDGQPLPCSDLAHFIDRMYKACNAETAGLAAQRLRPRQGVGHG